jgi:hypothetical protein
MTDLTGLKTPLEGTESAAGKATAAVVKDRISDDSVSPKMILVEEAKGSTVIEFKTEEIAYKDTVKAFWSVVFTPPKSLDVNYARRKKSKKIEGLKIEGIDEEIDLAAGP